MKLIIDNALAPSVSRRLRDAGYDSIHDNATRLRNELRIFSSACFPKWHLNSNLARLSLSPMIGSGFVRFPLLGNKSQIQQPTVFNGDPFATISEPDRGVMRLRPPRLPLLSLAQC